MTFNLEIAEKIKENRMSPLGEKHKVIKHDQQINDMQTFMINLANKQNEDHLIINKLQMKVDELEEENNNLKRQMNPSWYQRKKVVNL